MKKRIDYLDTAKGIAILAVVISHAISNSDNSFTADHYILLNWLSFFNVSTFFFINGYLYSEKSVDSPLKSMFKKIKAYYIPFISYNLFFMLFQNLFVKMHLIGEVNRISGISNFIKSFFGVLIGKMQPITGAMWFLRSLIVLSLMYILIDTISSRISDGKYRYIINGGLAIIFLILSKLSILPTAFNFPSACGAIIIYYLGVLYRKFEVNKYITKYSIPLFIITFIASVIIGNTFMVGMDGSISPTMDFISMIISLIMVITFSQFKFVSRSKFLKYLGHCSLEIMALHFLAFKPISYLLIRCHNLDISLLTNIPVVKTPGLSILWYIAYSTAGILLPASYYFLKTTVKKKINH